MEVPLRRSKRIADRLTPVALKRQKVLEDELIAGMSPLERLPRELLWKIIDSDPYILHDFRQVQLVSFFSKTFFF